MLLGRRAAGVAIAAVVLPVALAACGGVAPAGTARLDAGTAGTGPPYPIILAHGFAGFKELGPLEYFYHVHEILRADGHQIFVATVDPFNDSYVRGDELLAFTLSVLAETGAAKVDLIGHSQGGLDARYVAHMLPQSVAAVVTIATPNRGTPVADALLHSTTPAGQALLDSFLNAIGASVYDFAEPDGQAAFEAMTAAGAAAFNQRITDAPGVAYFSITGRSNLASAADGCPGVVEPPFIARWDADVDPVNPLLGATAALLTGDLLDPTTNDGLVPVSSARWGTFLGCLPADHFDEVGQIAGESPGLGNSFDYRLFYRDLADWLVAQGD